MHAFDELWNSPVAQTAELNSVRTTRPTPREIYKNQPFAELASQVFLRSSAAFTSMPAPAATTTTQAPAPQGDPRWGGIQARTGPPIGSIDRNAIARLQVIVNDFAAERGALANDRTVPAGLLQSLWTAHLGEIGMEYRGRLQQPYPDRSRAQLRDLGVLFRNMQELLRDAEVGFPALKLDPSPEAAASRSAAITVAAKSLTETPATKEKLLRGTSLASVAR